jgi:hypothetical protein
MLYLWLALELLDEMAVPMKTGIEGSQRAEPPTSLVRGKRSHLRLSTSCFGDDCPHG